MITYRSLQPSDMKRIMEIEARAFVDPWSPQAFRLTRSYASWVCLEDELLIGYCICLIVEDEASIANIAIEPAYQHKGYGTGLLQHSLEELKMMGARKIYLDVRRSNIAALMLYSKFGFRTMGIRKNYYDTPPEDALVMCWEDTDER
ncbi:MAG TPA: ribosomal protein S18-alanine N-acetyltransferase, partial [Candidatus Cloacimonadota bacterium]|nr:ribosomal protein S18-alanine N-acetyltransferase [Candidatus Cloacimonadota bacterium]